MTSTLIPFQIETQRVIQLLAKQIYQSPLALIRENAQNAFDAVRQRIHLGHSFEPRIDISLTPSTVAISDNGIGMTADDLRSHYWKAGSSSKNTDAARAAGVVGTFGIGAMANFGIADELIVETESAVTGERSRSRAVKATLSLQEDCIELDSITALGAPGTTITAKVSSDSLIDVDKAKAYVAEFISFVDIAVYVNGSLVSQRPLTDAVPLVPETWRVEKAREAIGGRLTGDLVLVLSNNADVWLQINNIVWDERALAGRLVLKSGNPTLHTLRSGFGLATASVTSVYQFGGVADLLLLQPTAGREAITVEGVQLLQSIMAEIDAYVSLVLSSRDECDASTPFMTWIIAHSRYDLCGRLRISVTPGDRISLSEVSSNPDRFLLFEGTDPAVIKLHANDDFPLLLLARNNPRRRCEQRYLAQFGKVKTIADRPAVSKARRGMQLTSTESGLVYRIETILDVDYFVKATVYFGVISHNLPVLAEQEKETVNIYINPESQSVKLLAGLYERDLTAFSSMAKDFVRSTIFPRIADYVPSSTRQGAEAFLKAIQRPRELFEYADDDLGSLPQIWEDYTEGRIPMDVAVERSQAAVRSSVQFVDVNTARPVHEVVPDILSNEQALQADLGGALSLEPTPAMTRLEIATPAKLLLIDADEPALRGYRCFLAISDKAREEVGEFFLQPHSTSVVWGGQKTLFIFLHHSGEFGLYYDLQTRDLVDAPTGGGAFPTATIVLKDRIFIPVPDLIRNSFVPETGERKRFEVRSDLLRTDTK